MVNHVARALLQDRGGERSEGLPALDLEVEEVLHVRPPRIGQDRAVAEGPRPPFRASLVPADDLAAGESLGGLHCQAVLVRDRLDTDLPPPAVHSPRLREPRGDRLADLRLAVCRTPGAVLHDEAVPWRAEHGVVDPEGRSQGGAGVAGRGLDVNVLDVRPVEELAVGERVHGAAAGQGQARQAGPPLEGAHQGEEALLVDGLERGGEVLVALRQLLVRAPGRPQELLQRRGEDPAELGVAVLPGHVHALGEVAEVAEVEPERAVRPRGHDLPELGGERGLAVGREPHHLVLVAEAGEARGTG